MQTQTANTTKTTMMIMLLISAARPVRPQNSDRDPDSLLMSAFATPDAANTTDLTALKTRGIAER